jgi:energy-coupling factor transporter ATP-binding protein EcfA2
MRDFTLHVEDFGKIGSADIELAPLTLFVGDNNSGKSYLMALIYGLFAGDFAAIFDRLILGPGHSDRSFATDIRDAVIKTSSDALYFNEIIKKMVSGEADQVYAFSEEDYTRFDRIINEFFERHKALFVAQVFNREIPIGKIQLKLHSSNSLSFSVNKTERMREGRLRKETYLNLNAGSAEKEQFLLSWLLDASDISDDARLVHAFAFYLSGSRQCDPMFLSTSRTGFMLTHKSLFKHSIEKSFSGRTNKTTDSATILTKPCIDFLASVSGFSYEQQKKAYRKEITDFIEARILQGKLSVNQLPTPDITYIPNGLNAGIPLHVSSGVVTETAPLVLALANPAIDYLMIEEPEMCLHPGLQKEMARALIRTVHSGTPVLASTHSDIILQHVNNIVRLKNHPERERIMKDLGYDEEDLLDPKDVQVYQFKSNGARSSVKEITFDPEDGFFAPTFIDALSDLLDETTKILREEE